MREQDGKAEPKSDLLCARYLFPFRSLFSVLTLTLTLCARVCLIRREKAPRAFGRRWPLPGVSGSPGSSGWPGSIGSNDLDE